MAERQKQSGMGWQWFALSAVTLLAMACGGAPSSSAEPATVSTGRVDGAPRMSCTPTPERSEWSERMEFAWLFTEQSFQLAAPQPPPAGATALEIQDWNDQVLRGWIQEKTHLVEAAHEELNLAAEEVHDQRVVAGALVGLMFEDLARVMLRMPVPSDLRDEPEILDAFNDVIHANARPYLEHSRRAYDACRLNTRGHADLAAWGEFCSGRGARLPADSNAENGQTTVEVLRE